MDANQIAETVKRLGSSYLASYARSAERYAELLAGAGKAGAQPRSAEHMQERYAAFVRNEGPRIVQQFAEASLNYYSFVLNAGVEAVKLYVEQVLQPGTQTAVSAPAPKPRSALLFRGAQGESPSNAFVIANSKGQPVDVSFDLPELVSEDGLSRLKPGVRFSPESCQLPPNSQQVVQCSVQLSDKLQPGVDYRGQIQVAGFPDMSMSVTVRAEEAPQSNTSTARPAKVTKGAKAATGRAAGTAKKKKAPARAPR